MTWISTKKAIPDDGKIVWTKIDDAQGKKNETRLKRNGNIWFFPDGSMCVYYSPTHWREDFSE